MFLCIIYLIVITILFVCSYKLFQAKYDAKPWGEVESVEEYAYIKVSRMSEKFAYYEQENIGIHFVIEKEVTGQWRTYIIAIDENKYNEYKEIIDYTYTPSETLKATDKKITISYTEGKITKNLSTKAVERFLNY